MSGVDAACAKIIQELKRQGVYDETLVIFTADNGLYHGEKGLAGKWYAHQESIRVPLVMVDPRMHPSHKNTTNDDFTLNIDLAPTILHAAGIAAPPTMQGKNIAQHYLHPKQQQPRQSKHANTAAGGGGAVNVIFGDTASATDDKDPEFSHIGNNQQYWRDDFFYEHPIIGETNTSHIPASTGLIRKDFKYISWTEEDSPFYAHPTVEQLFDLINDPKEEHDVSKQVDYYLILQRMRARHDELKEWVKTSMLTTSTSRTS